ncbi:MAG: hypothetical protein D6712_08810, partial [Chloroflexi bacterium]
MKTHKKALAITLLCLLLAVMAFGGIANAAEEEQQFATPILVVNTSFLNVRTGPGAGYTILMTVVGGTELPVLGVARDLVWYQVATDLGPGWVNVNFTLPRGDFSHVPYADVEDVAALGQGGGIATTGGSSTFVPTNEQFMWGVSVFGGDLHAGPSFETEKLRRVLPRMDDLVIPIMGSTSTDGLFWYLVSIPDFGTGWVAGNFIQWRPLLCWPNTSVVTLTGNHALGSGPDGIATSGAWLDAGTEAYVLAVQDNQVKILTQGGDIGWVALEVTQNRDDSVGSLCNGVVVHPSDLASGAIPAPVVSSSTSSSSSSSDGMSGFVPHNIERGP